MSTLRLLLEVYEVRVKWTHTGNHSVKLRLVMNKKMHS